MYDVLYYLYCIVSTLVSSYELDSEPRPGQYMRTVTWQLRYSLSDNDNQLLVELS